MPRPDFSPFAEAFDAADQVSILAGDDQHPWLIGALDQGGAQIRDLLDQLGVSVNDEQQVHDAMAGIAILMVALRQLQGVPVPLVQFAHSFALGLLAQLAPFVPDDARPR